MTVGGAMIGVSPASSKQSIFVYKTKNHYNEWEFLYSPLSDMPGMAGGTTGLPTGTNGSGTQTNNGFGLSNGNNGTGGSNTSSGTGSGSNGSNGSGSTQPPQ